MEFRMGDGFFRWALEYAQQYGLPPGMTPIQDAPFSGTAFWAPNDGRLEIEKRTCLEVLALKVPFGTIFALADSPAAEDLL
jgi:hypothetical protein